MNMIINWFEIPVSDLTRARQFYEAVLETTLHELTTDGQTLAVFPYDREGGATGGALVLSDGVKICQEGARVYLNAGESLDATLARVAPAGGQITTPRTELVQGRGAYAVIADTEGNRVGLHALK